MLVYFVPDQCDVVDRVFGAPVLKVLDNLRQPNHTIFLTHIEYDHRTLAISKITLDQGHERFLATSIPNLQSHALVVVYHDGHAFHINTDRGHFIAEMRVDKSDQERGLAT